MSGKDKRAKSRRKLYTPGNAPTWPSSSGTVFNGPPLAPATGPSLFQPFGNGVTVNVNEVATEFGLTLKPTTADTERITALMDAPVDLDIASHATSRGPNPYLDRCLNCNMLRPDTEEIEKGLVLIDLELDGNTVISNAENPQPLSSLKLEMWCCPECRNKAGKSFQSFWTYDLPSMSDKELPNPPQEEKETCDRGEWLKLHNLVRELYCCETGLNSTEEQELKLLIDKLCRIDPHGLFLALEDKVREIVSLMKTDLLTKLKENGCDKPELALDFTSSLLSHYDRLTHRAHILAQYLEGLSSHLKRFEVTWELLNKHLFHSIAHNDPAISSCGPTILEQLRQGSVLFEKSKDDPYCCVRKRLLKFQEEMSVVVVVWRDCQQLIENYCYEEVKNTHKHLSSKTKSFIYQQRQLLKDHLLRDPFSGEALSETMKNLMATHKSSMDRVMCHRCKRERCTCDECTITHRITCGIINSDTTGEQPPNSFNFALDHTRNVMDITPPSMSSTTSSSGSISPINIEDKLTTFYDHREEFSDTLLNCEDREGTAPSMNGDEHFVNGDEDEADDEDEDTDEYGEVQDAGGDEPHSLQDPAFLWEAMQEHQREQLRQQHVYLERMNHHSCTHRHNGKGEQCPFQPPINPQLSRELDAELAKSGLLPNGECDYARGSDLPLSSGDAGEESKGGGGDGTNGVVNPAMCATCQCHACLKQSGHVVSTSLPLQVSASPSPADLHLYPHIHGLPQQEPKNYFDLPHLMSSIKLPVKIDFDDTSALQDHFYHAYSDWDTPMPPRPGSLAAQHQHQQHQRLSSSHSSDLLPPPPIDPISPAFTFDLASHLATHTTHTSTTNTTSAFKSVTGKHFASSVMPRLSNLGNITSEGSSVDPTKPLDFASLAKIPQSCLNGTGAFLPAPSFSIPSSTISSSCVSSMSSPSVTLLASSTTNSTTKSNGVACQGGGPPPPPGSRPTPLGGNAATKWEKGRLQHCKKFTGGTYGGSGGTHTKQQQLQNQHQHQHSDSHNFCGGPPPSSGCTNADHHHHHHHHTSATPVSGSNHPHIKQGRGRTRSPPPPTSAPPSSSSPRPGGLTDSVPPASNSNSSGMVNNIGVGTSSLCNDPDCELHHGEDNCDSIDDSCSEKSSGTNTSNNQKEGKYCDCHYCEFFGHSATTAKTSTNYNETKNRLRQKLKKRQDEGKEKPSAGSNDVRQEVVNDEGPDPWDKRGIEDILKFIMGPDGERKAKEKEISAKAAKRARQKQKKLEEQAKSSDTSQSAESQRHENSPVSCDSINTQSQLNGSNVKHKKQTTNNIKHKMQLDDSQCHNSDEATDIKQEITRKSFIIKATRPTISVPKKEAEKKDFHLSTQNGVGACNKEPSFVNGSKSSNKQSLTCMSSTTANSDASKTHVSSSNKENAKVGDAGSQLGGSDKPQQHQQHLKRTPSKSSAQKTQTECQQSPVVNKTVNGKLLSQSPRSARKNAATKSSASSNNGKVIAQQSGLSVSSSNGAIPNHGMVNGHCDTKINSPVTDGGAGLPLSSNVSLPSSKSSPVMDSPGTGSGSSASQSPSCGTKTATDQAKQNGKAKKKKKNKNGGINCVDEIFMPKSESEMDADVDDFERELEEFKRFCFEPAAQPKERRKIAVNVNLKDIFKKKTGLV